MTILQTPGDFSEERDETILLTMSTIQHPAISHTLPTCKLRMVSSNAQANAEVDCACCGEIECPPDLSEDIQPVEKLLVGWTQLVLNASPPLVEAVLHHAPARRSEAPLVPPGIPFSTGLSVLELTAHHSAVGNPRKFAVCDDV